MMHPRKDEIYIIDFPFSDSQGSKKRPVLVVSTNRYNEDEPDVIVCGITSNETHDWSLPIKPDNLTHGQLYPDSAVRVDLLLRAPKEQFKIKAGKITDTFHDEITKKIIELLK